MATAGVGIGPSRNTSMPTAREAGDQRVLDHVAREPRILADHHAVAVVAALEDSAGGHADLQRDLRRHRKLVGAPADAVGAEIFPPCYSNVPLPFALGTPFATIRRIDITLCYSLFTIISKAFI